MMLEHDIDEVISVARCARHYGLSTRSVYRMIKEGVLPAELFGTWAIDWGDVWSLEQGPTPHPALHERYRMDLLSRKSLARMRGVSVKTVDRWIAAGLPTRNVGSNVRINPADAAHWLKASATRKAPHDAPARPIRRARRLRSAPGDTA